MSAAPKDAIGATRGHFVLGMFLVLSIRIADALRALFDSRFPKCPTMPRRFSLKWEFEFTSPRVTEGFSGWILIRDRRDIGLGVLLRHQRSGGAVFS